AAGIAAALAPALGGRAHAGGPDGTPEQIHLTWGDDAASTVFVSWASLAQARDPRVHLGRRANHLPRRLNAAERTYTDGLTGETVFTYHAELSGLEPGTTYYYQVTADNDSNAGQPFAASFQTAPRGRAAFRFTSFGDLATPVVKWVLSSA